MKKYTYADLCLDIAEKATQSPWEPCIGSGNSEMTALSHQEQEGSGTEFVCDFLPDWALGQSPRKEHNMWFVMQSRLMVPELANRLKRAIEALREVDGYGKLADELEDIQEEK